MGVGPWLTTDMSGMEAKMPYGACLFSAKKINAAFDIVRFLFDCLFYYSDVGEDSSAGLPRNMIHNIKLEKNDKNIQRNI